MATNTVKKREIKYLNRDHQSLMNDFIKFIQIYYPDVYQDFSEPSTAMMLAELMAYVGDNMSFYIDKKFNESFLETATEAKNITKHAKQLGFKAFGKSPAVGFTDAFIEIPATGSLGQILPDMRYALTIKKNAKLKSRNGAFYETLEDIDFSKIDITNPSYVQVQERDSTTNFPTTFLLRKDNVSYIAGETKTTQFTISGYQKNREIVLADEDVIEIISMTDSEGNSWYEVDYLCQDTVFDSSQNVGQDSDDVPYVLKLRSVPYRFVTEFNYATNLTSIYFGSGDAQTFDGELIPDLGDLSLPVFGKSTFTDFSLDPQNFLRTRTLGLTPVNTTLTVTYRVGGGENTNVGSGEIDSVADKGYEISDSSLSTSTVRDVVNSFAVYNPTPGIGGKEKMTLDEITQIMPAIYASQGRLVSGPDFIARTLSMPPKFGGIFRAASKTNSLNPNSVELVILSIDSNGYLVVASQKLKENLQKYLSRFRMLSNAIEILDGEIINIGVNVSILTNPDFNKLEVLSNCIVILKEFFNTKKWQLNQPINLTSIHALLAAVPGLVSVTSINISNIRGTVEGRSYSNTSYNIQENIKNNIVYCKENAQFELKYNNKDIVVTAK